MDDKSYNGLEEDKGLTAKNLYLLEKRESIQKRYKDKLRVLYDDVLVLKTRLVEKEKEEAELLAAEQVELSNLTML
jgi:hypothetical protein